MQLYAPTFFKAAGTAEKWTGMKEDSDAGEWYSREEVEAHIAEMQRSHDVTTAMLKASLAEAQQAIQRMTGELRTLDEKLRQLTG